MDWSAELSDFAETAALIENLDLIISVDTSTAHLAAAMGKPVWLLNRRDSCWRWRLSDQATPWYPSLRLFNQSRSGDWGAVIEEVRVELDQPRASFMKAMS
jgi:ADP-heptose:LPS heptosyltransferase